MAFLGASAKKSPPATEAIPPTKIYAVGAPSGIVPYESIGLNFSLPITLILILPPLV